MSALQSPQPPPAEGILTALINEIATISTRIILVLDDCHLIETQPILDALAFLLRRMPPQLHLVIATRVDPPLPLARLRVRGQLTELRATDLRFSSSEAAEFLNQMMGLGLAAEDIAALESRTEGWIAGLQLAAISMRDLDDATSFIQSFTGSNRLVLDYLIEEVLNQQSADVQDFLLQTAILDRMTGSLCDVLTSRESSQETLETLDRANLFVVPLDKERRWYRYHHLFADFLCRRLHLSQPDHLKALQHLASKWYEENGYTDEAIEYALRANDLDRVADLVSSVAETVWRRGEHGKLGRWLNALAVESVRAKPILACFYAWIQFASGQQDLAEASLQATESALIESGQSSDSVIALRGKIAAIRAAMATYRSDGAESIRQAQKALEYLPARDGIWRDTASVALGDAYVFTGDYLRAHEVHRDSLQKIQITGNAYLYVICSYKLMMSLKALGKLQLAIQLCQESWQYAQDHGIAHTAVIGMLFAIWGDLLAEVNDLDGATRLVEKGVVLAQSGADVVILGWAQMCLTRVLFSKGAYSEAAGIIQETKNSPLPPIISNQLTGWQIRIWLARNESSSAIQWGKEQGLTPEGEYDHVGGLVYIAFARILIIQGCYPEASELLQRLLADTEVGHHTSRAIQVLNLTALNLKAWGDSEKALSAISSALKLAQPGGFIRIFVDEGPPMAHLLYEALGRGIAPEYVQRLLAAFPVAESEQATPQKTQTPESDLIEPLSERELEVLGLFAQGLTNSEIASRLFLSPHTVKTHSSNIYSKLGVHRRTQAVARARALGILSST